MHRAWKTKSRVEYFFYNSLVQNCLISSMFDMENISDSDRLSCIHVRLLTLHVCMWEAWSYMDAELKLQKVLFRKKINEGWGVHWELEKIYSHLTCHLVMYCDICPGASMFHHFAWVLHWDNPFLKLRFQNINKFLASFSVLYCALYSVQQTLRNFALRWQDTIRSGLS